MYLLAGWTCKWLTPLCLIKDASFITIHTNVESESVLGSRKLEKRERKLFFQESCFICHWLITTLSYYLQTMTGKKNFPTHLDHEENVYHFERKVFWFRAQFLQVAQETRVKVRDKKAALWWCAEWKSSKPITNSNICMDIRNFKGVILGNSLVTKNATAAEVRSQLNYNSWCCQKGNNLFW